MPPTVLIVDDHAGFRRLARRLLEAGGFTVVGEAEDGTSALGAIEALRPELVLLGILLPDMDGFAVAERLAGQADAPIVVLTSSREAADFGARLQRSQCAGSSTRINSPGPLSRCSRSAHEQKAPTRSRTRPPRHRSRGGSREPAGRPARARCPSFRNPDRGDLDRCRAHRVGEAPGEPNRRPDDGDRVPLPRAASLMGRAAALHAARPHRESGHRRRDPPRRRFSERPTLDAGSSARVVAAAYLSWVVGNAIWLLFWNPVEAGARIARATCSCSRAIPASRGAGASRRPSRLGDRADGVRASRPTVAPCDTPGPPRDRPCGLGGRRARASPRRLHRLDRRHVR